MHIPCQGTIRLRDTEAAGDLCSSLLRPPGQLAIVGLAVTFLGCLQPPLVLSPAASHVAW